MRIGETKKIEDMELLKALKLIKECCVGTDCDKCRLRDAQNG